MKKIVLLLSINLCANIYLMAHTQTQSQWRDTAVEISGEWELRRIEPAKKMDIAGILNNFTIPFEIGCVYTPQVGQTRPGFYTRTGVEYRSYKTIGWCVAGEFDAYTRSYKKEDISNTNITQGRDWTIDLLVGGGYRFPLVKDFKEQLKRPEYNNKWTLGFMLYAGASNLSVENVAPAQTNDKGETTYHIDVKKTWVPSAKVTCSLEYSVCYGISIYTTIGYLQHFTKSPTQNNLVGDLINSFGLAFFFR